LRIFLHNKILIRVLKIRYGIRWIHIVLVKLSSFFPNFRKIHFHLLKA
jgi:hypothetical protein